LVADTICRVVKVVVVFRVAKVKGGRRKVVVAVVVMVGMVVGGGRTATDYYCRVLSAF